MDNPILEEKLKNMFENLADELPEDPGREARIRRNVYRQIEREGYFMKKGFMKKTVVTLAAICVLGSITAFAVEKITVRKSIFRRNSPMDTPFPALSRNIMKQPMTMASHSVATRPSTNLSR